jgi:Fe2+ transport system protein FeoA
MRRLVTLFALSFILAGAAETTPYVPVASQTVAFRIETNDFWLSLHQFLYALGMHEGQSPNRTRRAVVGAPIEVEARVNDLSAVERTQWAAAVTYYAKGPSTRDAVFDASLVRATEALAALGDAVAPTPAAATILGEEWRVMLDRVAPTYRRVWWPDHLRANRARLAEVTPLVEKHAPAILEVVTRAFGQKWAPAGFPVHLSSYATWSGAYSTGDNLLVVSSLDSGNAGLLGVETLFHEAMHQWDELTAAALRAAAEKAGTRVPPSLAHSLIFFTAGAALRKVEPAHVPYAVVNDLWPRFGLDIKAALDSAWQPFLDGRGTREQALIEVLRQLKEASRTQAAGATVPLRPSRRL